MATPRHNMHKYWGKKPAKNLLELIEQYSNVGDIVLDPFAGYGVFICEAYISGRNAIAIDLNPAATFIQSQLLSPEVKRTDIEGVLDAVLNSITPLEDYWYTATCPACGHDARVTSTLRSKSGQVLRNKIKCRCSSKLIEYELPAEAQEQLLKKERDYSIPVHPVAPLIRNGRISAMEGMTTDDLFTVRALSCHTHLMNSISDVKIPEIRGLLLFAFTANLANCSKLVPPIKSRGPMEPGAWMTGFYVGETYIENNVFRYFRNRISKVIAGKLDFWAECNRLRHVPDKGRVKDISHFDSNSKGYLIETADAKRLPYPDNSIDYVFTDPPYGDTVPYFEQSIIWNTWLGNDVDYKNEVVISDSKVWAKNTKEYEGDIATCIEEIWRVLKADRFFSITFHSISGDEWYALLSACLLSGFTFESMEWLSQKTFAPRQLNRKMTIKGDILFTFKKVIPTPAVKQLSLAETREISVLTVKESLKQGPKSTNEIYLELIETFFSQNALFARTNFVHILSDHANLDNDGLWHLSGNGR